MKDYIINDFTDLRFQSSFKEYFKELEIELNNWDSLFKEMNEEKDNFAILRMKDDMVVGFIQFKIDTLSNWFFEEKVGFIREFWINKNIRKEGHGASLLKLAEEHFMENKVYKSILTTDTASKFYIKNGYAFDPSYKALNEDDVYVKILK
ncbi:MAG: GNAT family N-acetyltransferase [Tissierellia bacterium]|jgi:predicted acetyltransferase|nr:GNAT family N-acetyltransferase [Tissierellia bacterium]